jgi:hypothetical protein
MNSKQSLLAIAGLSLTFCMGNVVAKVSPEQAAKLGKELTPVGAIRGGNVDGSIPEWTGGMTTPPVGYKGEGTSRIDPFSDEKPVLVITASNYKDHGEKLTQGQKALFERYPDTFNMPIYKTHRTAAAPQWVYDNTKTNATNAELTGGGDGVANAYGGYPFPIPQNGYEVIWNHTLRWLGQGSNKKYRNLTVYSNGDKTIGEGTLWETYPYFDPEGDVTSFGGNILNLLVQYSLPVRRKGEVILVRDPVNAVTSPRQAWQYIPGQRRVRRAPTIAYDTPNAQFSGQATYDDSFMWNGSPDRYDWKLIGKQEKYISYNNNGLLIAAEKGDAEIEKISTVHHMNPDYSRWEKHRVWVVEATLKDNKRHVYGKRTFYLDEDSWAVAATDIYDGRGNLWRAGFANLLNAYDVPTTAVRAYWHTDLQNGAYALNELDYQPIKFYQGEADKFYTPGQVRKMSRR